MKKLAIIGLLFLSACSVKIGAFGIRKWSAPMGIPKQGWEMCWDAIDPVMERFKSSQVPKVDLSPEEFECIRVGLMLTCGEVINHDADFRHKLWGDGELQFDPEQFEEYMDKQWEACEEKGNATERVQQILDIARDRFLKTQAICQ